MIAPRDPSPSIAERVEEILRAVLELLPEDMSARPASGRWTSWCCDLLHGSWNDRWASARNVVRDCRGAVEQLHELGRAAPTLELAFAEMRLAATELAATALSERTPGYEADVAKAEKDARAAIARVRQAKERLSSPKEDA
jgi:hypothetical protein